MEYFWWSLTMFLLLAGLLGTVVPLLPGTSIILAGAVLQHFTIHSRHAVGWWTLTGLTALTVFSYVFDLVSGSLGAKWYGATKWGAIGGIIGTVVGLFYGFVGIFIGPLLGVLVGELLGGKELLPASKSTWGTLLGTTAGIVIRVGIGLMMIVWFAVAALF